MGSGAGCSALPCTQGRAGRSCRGHTGEGTRFRPWSNPAPKSRLCPGVPVTFERIFIYELNWWFFTSIFISLGDREMLPWKTSQAGAAAAWSAAGSGWDCPPWGNTFCFHHHHHGPRHLQQKGPGEPWRTWKRGVPPSWARGVDTGRARSHSVFIVGSVSGGTYTLGRAGTGAACGGGQQQASPARCR